MYYHIPAFVSSRHSNSTTSAYIARITLSESSPYTSFCTQYFPYILKVWFSELFLSYLVYIQNTLVTWITFCSEKCYMCGLKLLGGECISQESIHCNGSRSQGTHGEHICTESDLKAGMKALVRVLFWINIKKIDRLDIAFSLTFALPLLFYLFLFLCTKE